MLKTQSVNDGLLAKLGVSMETYEEILRQKNNLQLDSFDKGCFSNMGKASQTLADLLGKREEPFPSLLEDVFGTYFKGNPELLPEKEVEGAYRFNRPFIEQLNELRETKLTRLSTKYDETMSALATLKTGATLLEEIEKSAELKEAMKKAQEAKNKAQKGDAQGAAKACQDMQDILDKNPRAMRVAMQKSAEAGQKATDDAEEALGAWGLGSGDLKNLPPDERFEVVRKLNLYDIKKLADMVGKMRNLARNKQKNKITSSPTELHNICSGNDIPRMLPTEYIYAGTPGLRSVFYKKLAEKQLTQYDLKAKEPQGKGPLVFAGDGSSSMQGQRMNWCVAVGMALVDIATTQKRYSFVEFFNTDVYFQEEFAPKEKDVTKMMKLATIGCSGGTEYEPPLKLAVEKIKQQNFKNADIVFTTDGACRVSESFLQEFLKIKASLNFKVYVVLVGDDEPGQITKWADKVWRVSSLTDDVAAEIFELI